MIKKKFSFLFLALFIIFSTSYVTLAEKNTNAAESFRVGPTVRLRPLDSEINKSQDGIVELFLNNPSLNDVKLEVDVSVDVPSDIYIYAEDGGMSGGAGAVTGHFTVPPGSSRTITLHIKGAKTGTYNVHFSGMYWPGTNKDEWNPISLDNSFEVKEVSENTVKTENTSTEKTPILNGIPVSYILGGILGGITAISGLLSIYSHFRNAN